MIYDDVMRVDMRVHSNIRAQVHAGLVALRIQGWQIWGGVDDGLPATWPDRSVEDTKRELGNILLGAIRWIDKLGLDVLECLDLAIENNEGMADSRREKKQW